ncbi:MAG: hypothetical protein AB1726_04365 [Planctomycetota bacterium]
MNPHPLARRLPAPAPLPLLALLALAACRAATTREATVSELAREGRFAAAYEQAELEAARAPSDPAAQAMLVRMRVVLILERGRRLLFAGSPAEALALFEDGLALDPGNRTVESWIAKTKRQLAEEWLDTAQELASVSRFDAAKEAFEKVLAYTPDCAPAKDGLYRLLVQEQYRLGLGRDYYTRGLEELRQYELWSSDRSLDLAQDYDPSQRRAEERRAEVRRMLAEERLTQADLLAAKQLFFAARNEYRLALLLDPANEAATAGLNRMDEEVRASRALEEAEVRARRGDLEEAQTLLEQGERFTQEQQDSFSLLKAQMAEARLRQMYEEAIALYRDQLFPEAVAAFDRLLQATESYEDAISRKRTLEEFIANAEALYAQALAAEDPAAALGYLREIEVFWSEYRDVHERIAALEAEVAAANSAGD